MKYDEGMTIPKELFNVTQHQRNINFNIKSVAIKLHYHCHTYVIVSRKTLHNLSKQNATNNVVYFDESLPLTTALDAPYSGVRIGANNIGAHML